MTLGLLCLYHGRWQAWKSVGPWLALIGSIVIGVNAAVVAAMLHRFPYVLAATGIAMTANFIVNGVLAGKSWRKVVWSSRNIALFFCMMIANTLQAVFTLLAFTLGPSAYVIAIKRTSVLIVAVIGYFFLKERDQSLPRLLLASGLVVLGIVVLILG